MAVIGSAEVVIRAVTTGVAADIQKALREAQAGARAAGKDAGDSYSSGFNESIARGLPDSIRNGVGTPDLSGAGDRAASSFGRGFRNRAERDGAESGDRSGTAFSRGFQKRVDKASSGPGIFEKFFGGDFDKKINQSAGALRGLIVQANFTGAAMSAMAGAMSAAVGGLGLLGLGAVAAAGSLVALPGLLMAVAQGGLVISQAMKGVGKAISAGLNPPGDTGASGKAAKAAAKAADAAAKAVEAANKRVAKASQDVEDAQEKLARAYEDASKRSRDALQRVEAAEQDLGDAQNDVLTTQLALNDARDAGAESLQQLGFRAEDAALGEQRAAMRLQEAFEDLQKVQDLPPDDKRRVEAELSFKESELNYRKSKDSAQDLAKEQEKAAAAGVEGTKEVVDAQQDIVDAQEKAVDSANKLRDAREAQGDVDRQNARAIADAQQGIADANANLADAIDGLNDAKQKLAEVGDAADDSTAKVDKFAAAMAKLSPEAQAFVRSVVALAPQWKAMRDEMGAPFLQALTPAFEKVTNVLIDGMQPALTRTSEIMGDMVTQLADYITSAEGLGKFQGFLDGNNKILEEFTKKTDGGKSAVESLVDLFLTLANVIQPVTQDFAEWTATLVKGWDAAANSAEGGAKLKDFFEKSSEIAKGFGQVFKGVWESFKTVLDVAMHGPIQEMLTMLTGLTTKLSETAAAGKANGDIASYFAGVTANLKPLLELLGSVSLVFLKLGTAPEMGQTFEILKGVTAPLEKILTAGGKAGPALATLVVSVVNLIAAFAESDAMSIFFDTLTMISDKITEIISSDIGQKIMEFIGPVHAVMAAVGLVIGMMMKFGPGLLKPVTMVMKMAAGLTGFFKNIFKLGSGGGGGAGGGTGPVGGGRGGDGGDGGDGGNGGDGKRGEDGRDGRDAGGGGTSSATRRGIAGGAGAAGGAAGGGGVRSRLEDLGDDDNDRRPVPRPSGGALGGAAAAGSHGVGGAGGLGEIGDGAERSAGKVGLLGGAFQKLGGIMSIAMGALPILIGLFTALYTNNEQFKAAIDKLMESFSGLISTVLTALMPVFEALMPVFQNLMGMLGTTLVSVVNAVTPLLNQLVSIITTTLMPIIEQMLPIITELFTTFGSLIGDVFAAVMPIITQIAQLLAGVLMEAFKALMPVVMTVLTSLMDLFKQLMPVVLPILTTIIQLLAGQLISVFQALMPVVVQVLGVIMDLFKQLVPVVLPIIKQLFEMLSGLLMKALMALLPIVVKVLTTFMDLFQRLAPVVLPIITKLFEMLSGLLMKALLALLPIVVKVLTLAMDLFEKLLAVVMPIIMKLVDLLLEILVPAIEGLMPVFDALMPIVETVFGYISTTIENVVRVFQGLIDFVTGIFSGDWEKVWNGVKDIFGGIWDQIKNIFNTLWTLISDFFTKLAPAIWDIVSGFAGKLAEWGGQFLSWLWDGIKNMATNVFSWFASLPGWIWDKVVAAASWMLDRGKEFIGWLWEGIKQTAVDLFKWFLDLPGKIWDQIVQASNTIITKGGEFIGWFIKGITDGIVGLWNWLTGPVTDSNSLVGGMWNAIKGLSETIIGFGGSVIGWLVDGIKKGFSKVVDAVSGLFGDLEFKPDGSIGGNDYWVASPFGGGVARGGVIPGSARGGIPGFTKGGVVPGRDPGRRDNILARLPNGRPWGLRSQESVFVPEFTRYIGGAPAVNMLNRAAEQGRLNDVLDLRRRGIAGTGSSRGGTGFLSGGVVGVGTGQVGKLSEGIRNKKIPAIADWAQTMFNWAIDKVKSIWQSLFGGSVEMDGVLKVDGHTAPLPAGPRGEFLKKIATQMGTPYVWGGDSPPNFDCSGLMSWALREVPGYGMGRLTAAGFDQSVPHSSMPGLPGDMVTFDTGRLGHGVAAHIGAILDPNQDLMMHTDGAGPARVSPYKSRDGGPLSVLNKFGSALSFVSKLARLVGLSGDPAESGSVVATGGSGVERWRSTVLRALQITGQPASYADIVLHQMDTESSGNPRAINLTDSNARKGTPSKGLVQVIDPTFASMALAPYNVDIWDPLSNIIAGIRWAIKAYGSLPAGMRGVAYDTGGMLGHNGFGVNLSGKPERILSPNQTQSFDRLVDSITSGRSGWSNSDSGVLSNREASLVSAIAKAVSARQGDTHVRVFIGERELTDIVDTQVGTYDQATARTIQLGRKP